MYRLENGLVKMLFFLIGKGKYSPLLTDIQPMKKINKIGEMNNENKVIKAGIEYENLEKNIFCSIFVLGRTARDV